MVPSASVNPSMLMLNGISAKVVKYPKPSKLHPFVWGKFNIYYEVYIDQCTSQVSLFV